MKTLFITVLIAWPLHAVAEAVSAGDGPTLPVVQESNESESVLSIRLAPDTPNSVTEYQSVIEQLEAEHGAYYQGLGENLVGLGLAHRLHGNHLAAAEAFEQALQIARINEGLHNVKHSALVDLIIDSYTLVGAWPNVDRYQQFWYWLQRRGHEPSDPAMVDALHRVAAWNLKAFQLDTGRPSFSHLVDARLALNKSVELIDQNKGAEDPRLLHALYAAAVTNLYMAAYVAHTLDSSMLGGDARFFSDPVRRQIQEDMERDNYIIDRFRDGRQALRRAAEIRSADPESRATSLVYLGDWNLLFDRSQTARRHYAKAYEIMKNGGVPAERMEQLLGQPVAIPAMRIDSGPETPATPAADTVNARYVVTQFDVSRSGRVRNVRIVEAQPLNDATIQRQARRELRKTRFRPRIEKGEAIATADVEKRFIFP
jgi:hypothetical protein